MEEENKIVMPLLGALVAAIVGGALWAAVVVLTEYELGLIAWAIGGMTGFAVGFLSDRRATQIHQIIAVIASLLGILLGKFFAFSYIINDGLTDFFHSFVIQLFMEVFPELFSMFDILFVLFAVVTAWRLPAAMSAKPQQPDQQQPTAPAEPNN
ncbi:hypothetical protein [Paenibacillus daejeonensis]|uniref:hypothetical protein n=1 Tax=Paenibacillus daejeonensis TaxID=135193 RepID=UPI00036E619B|nr:hypothetical protein [Paenibacillus daejeonensis]